MAIVAHRTQFSNTTQTAIADVSTTTSQITVSGADPFLLDLNIQTFIKHTFSADLDITITSPSGTVVTLTTDNGGGNDDVFNGTMWDDSANISGQLPYTSNNGLVTDRLYTNNVLASPLVPEGALGAFFGENPNGIWTISITDDLASDTGTLDGWSLDLTAATSAPATQAQAFNNATPVVIDAGAPNTVTSKIVVSGAQHHLVDLNLQTFIQHTFASDLDITITSPSGTVVTLTTDNGSSNDNVFNGTLWDDDGAFTATDNTYADNVVAASLVPEEAFAAFIGEDPNGTWTLTVSDDADGDGGSLNAWSLFINSSADAILASRADSDFNGDKTSDVLWRSSVDGSVAEWQFNAANIVNNQQVGKLDGTWHFQDTGDFNFDGAADALWRNDSGQVVIWSLDGTQITANQSVGTLSSAFHNEGVADFNADGHSDVLWRHSSGQVVLWTMDGANIVGNQEVGVVSNQYHIQALLDANGDSKSDVLLRHNNGQVVLWTMNGSQIVGNESIANVGLDFHIVGTGDFGGDGKDDILLRNDSGQIVLWTMNGAQIVDNQQVGIIGPEFHIEDLGDYNHDGKTDVLLRHSNGQVVMWEMDGATITSNHAVLSGATPAVVASNLSVLNHHFDIV